MRLFDLAFEKKHRFLFIIFLHILTACGPVRFFSDSSPVQSEGAKTGPPASTQEYREISYNGIAQPADNKLDILLVIDNSNSMLADNQKLAQKLSGFVNDLESSNIDWQMCASTTSTLLSGSSYKWGASVIWQGYAPASGVPSYLLKKGTIGLTSIFGNTIDSIGAGWANTDDERGIKAAWRHVYNGDINFPAEASGCYRRDAAMATIIISDEDERSIGGDATQEYYPGEFKTLENEDLPDVYIQQVKNIFGSAKRFTVNSIIVKPGDSACMQTQDAEGSKSHYGNMYAKLSNLTGGAVSSICNTDFSTNLNLFRDVIKTSIASLPLECLPVQNEITLRVTPAIPGLNYNVNGMNLNFTPQIPAGSNISLIYKCLK